MGVQEGKRSEKVKFQERRGSNKAVTGTGNQTNHETSLREQRKGPKAKARNLWTLLVQVVGYMLVKLSKDLLWQSKCAETCLKYVERLPVITRNVSSGMRSGVKPDLP